MDTYDRMRNVNTLRKLVDEFHDKLVYFCLNRNPDSEFNTERYKLLYNKFKQDASEIFTKELVESMLYINAYDLGFTFFRDDAEYGYYMRIPIHFLEILPEGLTVYTLQPDKTLKPAIVGKDCVPISDTHPDVFIRIDYKK